MLRLLEEAVSRRALAAGSALLFGFGAVQAQASVNLLDNPSFEFPNVGFPTTPNPTEADFVDLTIDEWDKTGPEGNDSRAPIGVQDTGRVLERAI